ncbi:SigB/SigF/SigG family RNA polymerase sigma factor [Salininema proteolyticum]|uniref:SigB/SigF/SigG family RNA polymerase sigma factor n=1 Tax=Salininema proteolyticum TaxID=1607685 RepID=A0ABV8U521_9ACTN
MRNCERRSEDYGHLKPLLAEMSVREEGDSGRVVLREQAIIGYLPLAEHIARRFTGKGIAKEDLLQVASVGLIHAVDRFDPDKCSDFLAFAVPTIMGEVRRFFRDTSWPMRMPRRLQELRLALNQANGELAQVLGRPPTSVELAEHLGIPENDVEDGAKACHAFRAVSLDGAPSGQEVPTALCEIMGEEDVAFELIEDCESLVPLIHDLPSRERRILALRYFRDITQSEIANCVGVSQMHVSRLLKRTLVDLKENLLTTASL